MQASGGPEARAASRALSMLSVCKSQMKSADTLASPKSG